jgi:hypothetical protein
MTLVSYIGQADVHERERWYYVLERVLHILNTYSHFDWNSSFALSKVTKLQLHIKGPFTVAIYLPIYLPGYVLLYLRVLLTVN